MEETKMAIRMQKVTTDLQHLRKGDGDAKADARKDGAIARGMRRLAEKILGAP